MRAVVQVVSMANVKVKNEIIGEIPKGFMILIGVEKNDTVKDADYIIKKIVGLRVFNDENDKMNLSINEVKGEVLAISQFTLLGDSRNGNRPSFINSEEPQKANELYEYVCQGIQDRGIPVQKGVFGAEMKVMLVNEGPVTIILDSKKIL